MSDLKVIASRGLNLEKKYNLLLQITEKISGTLNLDEQLANLIDTVRSVIDYDAAGIFVITLSGLTIKRGARTPLIEGMLMRGFNTHKETDPMLNLGKGIVGHVIQTGESVILPDVRNDPRYVAGRPQTNSEITVPMKLNERVVGALNLESDRFDAFSEDDLEVLQFIANVATASIEKAMLHRELLEKRRIDSQLDVARQVQASLLPSAAPKYSGYTIAAVNLPTYEIGGDYYDYIELPSNQIGIAIADVSGKGVPASLIMSMFRAALRTQVRNDNDIAHVMRMVNYLLWESTTPAQFVTAVYGILDTLTAQFTYTNCGHNPPLLIRSDASVESLDKGGQALGFFDNAKYEEASVTLNSGDALVLYTDGVIEVFNDSDQEFGVDRLKQTLVGAQRLPAFEITRAIREATQNFSGKDNYQDDFTVVVVKREM